MCVCVCLCVYVSWAGCVISSIPFLLFSSLTGVTTTDLFLDSSISRCCIMPSSAWNRVLFFFSLSLSVFLYISFLASKWKIITNRSRNFTKEKRGRRTRKTFFRRSECLGVRWGWIFDVFLLFFWALIIVPSLWVFFCAYTLAVNRIVRWIFFFYIHFWFGSVSNWFWFRFR